MSMWWKSATMVAVAAGLFLGPVGCGVKEYVNCRNICNKKKECGSNSAYDVENCVNACTRDADASADYARKVNTCKECIDPISCTDPKFAGCFSNCPSLP